MIILHFHPSILLFAAVNFASEGLKFYHLFQKNNLNRSLPDVDLCRGGGWVGGDGEGWWMRLVQISLFENAELRLK